MSAARVLVVEDEQVLARIICRTLVRKFGAEVDSAANGQLGLEHANTQSYDLILSDIRMPELDGISMVERIRSGQGPNCETAVVLVTGHHEEGTEAAAQLRARFLGKPFSRQVLVEFLRGLIPGYG